MASLVLGGSGGGEAWDGAGPPGVHLADGDVEPVCDVLHGLGPFRNDAHPLGNSLGSDGMVTCHHDHL